MSGEESRGPGALGLEAAHLQPDLGESYEWADNAAEQKRAAQIDRLAGDRDLVGELRRRGFSGPEYERTAEELARYGVAVVTAWILRGTVFDRCARIGRAVERPPIGTLDHDEALSIAGEVVTVALRRFRDEVLLPGRWDPSRGASLTTFFVGQCLLRFPNVYRRWLGQQPPPRPADTDAVLEQRSTGESVEDDVIQERMAVEALRLVRSKDARRALVMTSLGYSQAEIAARLGTTEKAVERMIAYARQQVQRGRRSA